MDTAPHTPGPWSVVSFAKTNVVRGAHGRGIARLYRSAVNPNCDADADLISAAPDLLASVQEFLALREWMILVGGMEGPVPQHLIHEQAVRSMAVVERASAAVAKAKNAVTIGND